MKASNLVIEQCDKRTAVELTRKWHSRLPNTQDGPWRFAFCAHAGGKIYAVALWHNPSARGLPQQWLELRRMACSPDAPKYTASCMLGAMVRWFKENMPEAERCISYQDVMVHTGTIYKAANWVPTHFSRPRRRDRSRPRGGTQRAYRSDMNTSNVAAAGKIRWEIGLTKAERRAVEAKRLDYDLEDLKRVKPTR